VVDDREVRRWPEINVDYRFEQSWASFKESLKERDKVEKKWKQREKSLDSIVKVTFPKRAFYAQECSQSGGGPKMDWQAGYIKVRVYDSTEFFGAQLIYPLCAQLNYLF
jgi:hypothetical protein